MDIQYKPLSEVKQKLKVNWYRCPIEKEVLKSLTLKTDYQGWFQAGGHFLIFIITGAFTYYFWYMEVWYAFLFSLFIHGTVSSFLFGVAPHELGHGTVFRSKSLNKSFLYIFSLITWWDPYDYAVSHTYHHRYTQYDEADRENLFPIEPSLSFFVLLQLFTFNIFSKPERIFGKGGLLSAIHFTILSANGKTGSIDIPIQEWLNSLHQNQPSEHKKSIVWSRLLLTFHGGILVFSLLSGQWVFPLIISTASFTANWGTYFLGLTQHCGLMGSVPDFRKNTRTILLNPVFSYFYWHMNWHIEHHMYAGVPCYNLKKLNLILAEHMPKPRTLIGAWKEMLKISKRQTEEINYQFDTEVPESKKNEIITDDMLSSSIGDLAPSTLA
ncbi:MAG: fatty acid desaturase [SAR324 cluster bacterium]|nr:fatty acid desaturase [SAR324 cluster bacterium]